MTWSADRAPVLSSSVVVGVDLDQRAGWILSRALHLAERLSARLDVVHVYAPWTALERAATGTGIISALDRLAAERQSRLSQMCNDVVGERVPVTTHLRVGQRRAELLEAVRELSPTVVVVGAARRRWGLRMWLRDLAGQLCRDSPVPVLVVPVPPGPVPAELTERRRTGGAPSAASLVNLRLIK